MLKFRGRLVRAVSALALIAVLAGGGTALAGPTAYEGHLGELKGVAEVQGHWTYLFRDQPAMFWVHAWKDADDTVHGRYFAWMQALDLRITGSVTCLNVQDNRGWVAGDADRVWSTQDFGWVLDSETWFLMIDNGDENGLGSANPDITTSIGAAEAPAGIDWCNAMPDPRFPFPVMSGNLIVRDGQ